MIREYLNVAIADPEEGVHGLFKNIFQEMKMEIRVWSFYTGKDLTDDLGNKHPTLPDVLFLKYDLPDEKSMECL